MHSINEWIEIVFEESYMLLADRQHFPSFYDLCYSTTDEVNLTLRHVVELKEGVPVEQKEFCSFAAIEQHVSELVLEHSYLDYGLLINVPVKRVW